MKRMFRFTQSRRYAVLRYSISALYSSSMLAGCPGGVSSEDAPAPEAEHAASQEYLSSTFRPAPLRECAPGRPLKTSGRDKTVLEADRLGARREGFFSTLETRPGRAITRLT